MLHARARLSPRLLGTAFVAATALVAAPAVAVTPTALQITRLEENFGPKRGGNTVTIRGTGFGAQGNIRHVQFGTRPALGFTVASETEIRALAPPGSGEAEVTVTDGTGASSPPAPVANYAYIQPTEGPWLGLNGNSLTSLGPVDAFVEHGVSYDRSGQTEWVAGETLAQSHQGLQRSIDAGMIPVVTIEYRAYESCSFGSQCLPTSAHDITEYVRGFISSAREILARYPAAPILFEAANEPWGNGSAAQYAAILASLLPAASRAGLPMDRIYAGATGNGWIRSLYAARPQLADEIRGWYVHPYNAERSPGEGIASLPKLQDEMTSGQANVIVSEIGFCAPDVNHSTEFCASGPAPTHDSADAAAALKSELQAAEPLHRTGWLRALIVYSRNDRGWAMQLRGGTLTAQGQALEAFADANP